MGQLVYHEFENLTLTYISKSFLKLLVYTHFFYKQQVYKQRGSQIISGLATEPSNAAIAKQLHIKN